MRTIANIIRVAGLIGVGFGGLSVVVAIFNASSNSLFAATAIGTGAGLFIIGVVILAWGQVISEFAEHMQTLVEVQDELHRLSLQLGNQEKALGHKLDLLIHHVERTANATEALAQTVVKK